MADKKHSLIECWNKVVYNNDRSAFDQLFHLLHAKCLRLCSQVIGNPELAEEIVSDVFVDCWVKRALLAHVEKPEIYLLVAVKNRALNESRKFPRLRIVSPIDDCDELASSYRPDEELERKELLFAFDKAVDTLPLQCKMIFLMVKEDGMKCSEVAEVLNVSPGTVRTQVFRAVKKLRELLPVVKQRTGMDVVQIATTVIVLLQIFFAPL